jgi:hypothetical protein
MTLNNDTIGSYMALAPFKANFLDTLDANALKLVSIRDDLGASCVLQYYLYNVADTGDVTQMYSSTFVIDGDNYAAWGSADINVYPYTLLAQTLGLTLL